MYILSVYTSFKDYKIKINMELLIIIYIIFVFNTSYKNIRTLFELDRNPFKYAEHKSIWLDLNLSYHRPRHVRNDK